MQTSDSFTKQGTVCIPVKPKLAFRLKMVLNMLVHLVFAVLYGLEHRHQGILHSTTNSSDNAPVSNSVHA